MSNLSNWHAGSVRKLTEFGTETGATVLTEIDDAKALESERKRCHRVYSIHFIKSIEGDLPLNRYTIVMPGVLARWEAKLTQEHRDALKNFVQAKWYRRLLFWAIRYKL